MDEQEETRLENEAHLGDVFVKMLAKCKAAMDAGPTGGDVTLSPEEATLLYRMFTESCRVRAAQDRIRQDIEAVCQDMMCGARRTDHRFRL